MYFTLLVNENDNPNVVVSNNICLFWFIGTKMIVLKGLMAKGINYLKVLSKAITSLLVEKSLYGQPVDSDIKRYKEIRMLTTGKGEDYTTGCFF